MFKCPKCNKVYSKNGKWIRKHMIEVCHVSSLNPITLVESNNLETKIESIVKKVLSENGFKSNGIISIKPNNKKKYVSTVKIDFTNVVRELKQVFQKDNYGLIPINLTKKESLSTMKDNIIEITNKSVV